jgi:hypothetical protein
MGTITEGGTTPCEYGQHHPKGWVFRWNERVSQLSGEGSLFLSEYVYQFCQLQWTSDSSFFNLSLRTQASDFPGKVPGL